MRSPAFKRPSNEENSQTASSTEIEYINWNQTNSTASNVGMEWSAVRKQWFTCGVLMILALGACAIPTCTANLGSLNIVEMSGIYTSDPELEMPSANVSIHIVEIGNRLYSIEISCVFKVVALSLRNSTLAFVYPTTWINESIAFEAERMFNITLDDESINYTLSTREDIEEQFGIPVDGLNVGFEGLAFAQFNVTLSPNGTHFAKVETSFTQVAETDRYLVQYFFGSAKTFSGSTQERVSLEINQQSQPLELNLSPESGLVIIDSGLTTRAEWDFIVSDLEEHTVSIEFVYSYPPYYYHNYLYDFLIIGIPLIIMIGIVIYRKGKQHTEPDFQ